VKGSKMTKHGNHVAGVDIGGTRIKAAVLDLKGSIIGDKISRPTQGERGPEATLHGIAAAVLEAIKESGIGKDDLLGLGIGSPGPLNPGTGIVYETPNIPGWENLALRDILAEKTGLRAFLDNDANAAAIAELWVGEGREVSTLICLTLGTGIGGGVLIDGKVLRGIDGSAAELGHITINPDGPVCGCGNSGCLEAFASTKGILDRTVGGILTGQETVLTQMVASLEDITPKTIYDAAKQNDAYAKEVFADLGRYLGIGSASLVNIFNPEMIVLSGGISAAAEEFIIPSMRREIDRRTFEIPAKRVQIRVSRLGDDAGVTGAAGVVLHDLGMLNK
jgi:glucokinase